MKKYLVAFGGLTMQAATIVSADTEDAARCNAADKLHREIGVRLEWIHDQMTTDRVVIVDASIMDTITSDRYAAGIRAMPSPLPPVAERAIDAIRRAAADPDDILEIDDQGQCRWTWNGHRCVNRAGHPGRHVIDDGRMFPADTAGPQR